MKIFVVHYKKLFERKNHILYQFKKFNIIDYEFIEIDRDELYKENISMFEENYYNYQIAISLSHFYAYKEISEKYDNALILEDDVILSDNFINIFNNYIRQLPEDYDMLFIGNGCNHHIQECNLISNKNIYEKSVHFNDASRCADSYVINKKCAKKLCEYINNVSYKINMPIDYWLNLAAKDNNLKIYWAEPTIVSQGSQTGLFHPSH